MAFVSRSRSSLGAVVAIAVITLIVGTAEARFFRPFAMVSTTSAASALQSGSGSGRRKGSRNGNGNRANGVNDPNLNLRRAIDGIKRRIHNGLRKRNHNHNPNPRPGFLIASVHSSPDTAHEISSDSFEDDQEEDLFGLEATVPRHSPLTLVPRGGGCKDSNPRMFAKVAFSSLLESAALLGILKAGQRFATKFAIKPMLLGLPLTQSISVLTIIFGSSFVGSLIDGSLSVASNQALNPSSTPGEEGWFDKLKKPSWNPPGWVFPIMWLIVSKPTQAMAVARILKADAGATYQVSQRIWRILGVYCTHLALGDAWNKVFFDLQCTGRGAAVISVFGGALFTSAALFGTVDQMAGKLMLPTCGWVAVASALNFSIYRLNKSPPPTASSKKARMF